MTKKRIKTKKRPKKEETGVIAKGVIRIHPRGFGFLVPTDRKAFPEDIFIPRHLTNGAVDSDTVEVEINTASVSEKGPEGAVITILERGRRHVAGTLTTLFATGDALAYVPLLGANSKMKIQKSSERDFTVGDRLIIHVLRWEPEALGEMSSYLGHISDPSCDVSALIEEFEIKDSFSQEALKEAKSFGKSVKKEEMEGREDLRGLECFTIDPDTAKDFDDALSLSQDSEGNFHLAVHISDVSHYVQPKTALDDEARKKCNSVYFPGTVVPMLPHELSSHLCSLKPDVNRLAVSVLMTFDPTGTLLNYRMTRSVIFSQKRFTYKEAKEVLDGKKKSKHSKTLFLMCDLCHRLKQKRAERGSIEFSIPGISVHVDPQGTPTHIEMIEYDITHQLVEEFMLKANEVVAQHLAEEGKPLTYRIHDEPNPENMKDFAQLAHAFGYHLSNEPKTEELQALFDAARNTAVGQFLATAFIRNMKLASYSVQNIGHYGLGLDYYTHFTSPIRRYIDLIVHRVLFNQLQSQENLDAVALQCSEKERLSAKAEGCAILLKKLRLLQKSQKKEPKKAYKAILTEIKPFGIVFEIPEFYLEGFLPLSEMKDDYFHFDPKTRRLMGQKTRRSFRPGDQIEIELFHLNLATQEVKWKMVRKKKT